MIKTIGSPCRYQFIFVLSVCLGLFFAAPGDCIGQFSSPTALTFQPTTGTLQYILPTIATDGSGTWIGAWTAAETSGSIDLANLDASSIATDITSMIAKGSIITRRSTDNGRSWSAPLNLSLNHSSSVVVNPSSAIALNPSSAMVRNFLPHVASSGNGKWLAVWNSDDSLSNTIGGDFDILYSRSIDGGTTWSAPAPLAKNASSDKTMDLMPQVAADGKGRCVAVWSTRQSERKLADSDIMVSRSSDHGATWSNPYLLYRLGMHLDIASDIWPQIATDSLGHWVVAWESIGINRERNITMTIKVTRSTNNGVTWTRPVDLSRIIMPPDTMEMPQLPRLATDSKGNWVIAWSQDWRIYASRSIDNGTTWSAAVRVDQDPVPLEMDFYNFLPSVAADGLGNWLISWNAADVYAYLSGTLDLDILVSGSFNRGATWQTPSLLNEDALWDARIDTWSQLAADSSGNWVTLWQGTEGPTSATMVTNILSATARLEPPPTPVTSARDWTLY